MLKDLFLLDPQVIYLNHGSFGACPRPVFEKYQAWQRQLELQPVQFLGVELDQYLHQAREKLGEYLHTTPGELVFVPNVTHGVNIIARSLRLSEGDEILSTNQEYGACNYTWVFMAGKTGAIYKRQPITMPATSSEQIEEDLWQAVTSHTRVIFISHIASPTSLTFPVQQICQRARQAGILTIIDGAHAPGQLDLDLAALQADFYVGNCHKWMLSPKGAGFLYARPEVQDLVEPLVVSWGYQGGFGTMHESKFIDYLQWTGTKDPSAALSVPTAIEFMQEYHWDEVRIACHALLREATMQISNQTGLSPLYPLDSDLYHQMGTIPIPQMREINELKSRLYSDYKIEIPCIEWENRHFLRISVQGYNTADDLERLVAALAGILPKLKAS